MEVLHKRMRSTEEGSEGEGGGEVAEVEEEALETSMASASEEVEAKVQAILDKIEQFTQQVSDLLDAGKAMFNNMSAQYEARLISIHREHVDKWQEEIKELRLLDSSHEEGRAHLHNAQMLLFQSFAQENR